ncbi:hypothetical protein CHUAL_005093 [Chamberlinius hualienensis]
MVGTHGKWQWLLFFLTSMSGFFVSFQQIGAVFLAATPDHWCSVNHYEAALNDRNLNWTLQEVKDTFIPKTSSGTIDSCHYYRLEIDKLSDDDLKNVTRVQNSISNGSLANVYKEQCSLWTYSNEQYTSTVISEWDLVCSKKALGSTVQSSFMAGVLIGCLASGWISDRFGRRKAVLISTALFVGAAIIASFSVNYVMFLVFRFICALGDAGVFSVTFVVIMEILGRSSRAFLGLQFMAPFSLGFMLLPLLAYFVRDWFQLQLIISVPCVLLLSYFWLLPESPRWLLAQGRVRESLEVLKVGAKMNNRILPSDDEMFEILKSAKTKDRKPTAEEQKSGNFFDLVRTPVLRRRSLITGLVWFVVGMAYYGLSFSGSSLGVSMYIYVALAAAVEFPAFFFVYVFIQKFGRKPVYVSGMVISGLCCLILIIIPNDVLWALSTVAILGKFFSTAAFGLCFLYTVELFPTPVRNLAVGTGAMLSRLGAVVAPFVVDLLGQYHSMIPMIIFGSLSMLSGLLSLLLPETKGCNLAETVEEVENSKKLDRKEELTSLKPRNDTAVPTA